VRSNRVPAVALLSALGLALPGAASAAQEPAPRPAASPAASQVRELPTFAAATSAVTLDVVVRDKRGRMVRDLTQADFEVYEDGAKQAIETFEVFGRRGGEKAGAAAAPAAPAAIDPLPGPAGTPGSRPLPTAAAPPADPQQRPQVIAFVFDRLSAEARSLAHKAALGYLEGGHVAGDLVGVFAIDLALRTIQPFTDSTGLIRAGLQRAASQANTSFSSDRASMRDLLDGAIAGQEAGDAAAGASPSGPGAATVGQGAGAAAASGAIAQAVASLQVQMLRSFEALERDQQGFATTNALLAVVSGLRSLPGRKTVVFFSEGLAIPPNVAAQFRSVIHTANRGNVSVYAMDAAGLRAQSMNDEMHREMRQAAARRRREIESGRDDPGGGSMIQALERNEDLLRLHPESGLGQLAAETGGFLIRDTNDAASAFRRIEEDMRFQYLIGYTPSNENYDGRFRSIAVKLKRPGLQVQTRQGYYAVRAEEAKPLRGYEAPALAQLDRPQRPSSFPLHALGLSFPDPLRPGLASVLVRVPGEAISYERDKSDKSPGKLHRADFTVLVRIRDEAGRDVDRLSQRYLLSAPEAGLAEARRGDVLFYRQPLLLPGRYRLEAVAYDGLTRRASVSTVSLEVPAAQAGRLRLSSIVIVGRAEKLGEAEAKSDNPLFYGDTVIYPNMGEPLPKATTSALGFFFTVYGGAAAASTATIEVLRAGAPAGRTTAELPAPDASGRIQFAGALPLHGFGPGSYELKVTVGEGPSSDTQRARFTLAE
jgi:VWFA-related protein